MRLDAALGEAVNLIRALAAQTACRVSDAPDAPGRWVRADRQRLAQVLLNLLSNGVKYNRPGGSVRLSWEEGDGRLRIGVHDTGRGIDPERMEELFVPFAWLGAEQTGVEGTGLGLALSHRLAEAMGGSLTAEPEITLLSAMQGRMGLDLAWEHAPDLILLDLHLPDISGGEVLRRLRADRRTRDTPGVVISADRHPGASRAPPCRRRARVHDQAPGPGPLYGDRRPRPRRTGSPAVIPRTVEEAAILVVDDERANLDLLEEFLRFDGFENVTLTTDPRQVPGLFEAKRPDILLLDLHMPYVDGFSVMRQLRATIPTSDYFPILVLTADVTSETKLRALSEGASDFLTKPLDAVEVVLRIRNLLATRFLHLGERAARARAEAAEARAAFLAQASRVLSSSFEYRAMLSTVARLAVPRLADYVVVEMMDSDGQNERIAYAHADSEQEQLLAGGDGLWGGTVPRSHPLVQGCTGGQFLLVADVAAELGPDAGDDEAQREILRRLSPRSVASVPLVASGEVMGGVTLVTAGSGRTLDADDLGLAEELARRIMVAVEHAQLYHDALQATRARDEILGVVAHDLRNPLSTIRMAAQLMADDVAPAHRKPMDMMLRTTDRMNQLIQDLLEVTRMESGKLALELSAESPGAVLREASAMLAPLAAARSITFEAQIADDLPRLPLDSSRVLQVISNLVGNAIKFTPARGQVTLGAQLAGSEVRISVADTGPGIPADQIPRVFGRFWQAGKTDRRGIGLGLSIARGIVEAHGGRIWIESVEGEGATFFFTLPVRDA